MRSKNVLTRKETSWMNKRKEVEIAFGIIIYSASHAHAILFKDTET